MYVHIMMGEDDNKDIMCNIMEATCNIMVVREPW